MANFLRVIGLVLLLVSSQAQAVIQPQVAYRVNDSGVLSAYDYSGLEAACVSSHGQQVAAVKVAPFGWSGTYTWQGAFGCVIFANGDLQRSLGGLRIEQGFKCPAGTTINAAQTECVPDAGSCLLGMEPGPDGVCACKAGTHEVDGACFPNKSELEEFCKSHAAPKNTFSQSGTIGSTSPTPQASCYKPYPPFSGADAARGCAMTLHDTLKAPRADGLMDWSSTGVMTGATCEDAAATDSAPKAGPDKCPAGFPGTVNGTEVCVPVEPDKGIEGTKTSSSTAADGTKTDITEVTKCEGTVCTTTTTTKSTTSAGAVTSSSSSVTQSLADKCVKDPANKVCTKTGTTGGGGGGGGGKGDGDAGPSSFGGSCASGFKAESDDAVLNAMAEEQYRRNCELLRTDTDVSTWLQGEGQKTGDRTGDLAGNKDVSISGADIDTSDALGGGGCNLDKTITVAKMTVTLPFGKVCEPLEIFGQLLVAVSMLLAGRIIMRG